MRDESERLVQELKDLEARKGEIEARKRTRLGEAKEVVLDLLVSQYLLGSNDPVVTELQRAVEERRKGINAEEEENRACHKLAVKELEQLTAPEIRRGLETFGRESSSMKLTHKVLRSMPGGFSMRNRIEVESNAAAIGEVQKLIKGGQETIQTMQHNTVSEIRTFVDEQTKKIRSVDLSPKKVVMDSEVHERFQFVSSQPTRAT